MSDFNLDREMSIKENVDANGRQWKIHINRSTGLCYVRPEPNRADAVIPQAMQGLWTKPSLLLPQLSKYLADSWDQAEAANAKAERKREAAREHAAKAKEAKVDAGTADK